MSDWTRRDFLKTGVAATTGTALLPGSKLPLLGQLDSEAASPAGPSAAGAASPRQRLLMDPGWRFHLGNACDPEKDFGYGRGSEYSKTGQLFLPSRPSFDDSSWRLLDLPHDWAVELPFVNDPEITGHGSKPLGRRYPATSIGWYRRLFDLGPEDKGRRLWLEFDGAYRDCIVALNGDYLGRNMSGYAPFSYDITDFANYEGRNVLVVRADATEEEGWFYEGAGIYRHVWLVKAAPLHVPQWGSYVTTAQRGRSATVSLVTEIANDQDASSECEVATTLFDPEGREVATRSTQLDPLAGWEKRECRQQFAVADPLPWSLETPRLYKVVTTLRAGGAIVDQYETPFGIRSIRFDANRGFFLNGQHVKIQGTCNHQDHAGLGSALPDRMQAYRIERLKAMGVNGYRTSHNPPTPELLDACDRLGMLVMDETRMFSSDAEGQSQLTRLIRRDRNHPSVVIWSIGNEEPTQASPRGARIAASQKRLARKLDPTRPVTEAMNYGWGHGLSDVVDVQGFNYGKGEAMDAYHAAHPNQPCIGTETASTVSTRGIYFNDPERGYVSAYDLNYPSWANTAEQWWQIYAPRDYLCGGFAWTGFDYRGETTPYGWPCINSHFGILDTCGFPKDNFFYYQAWWTNRAVLHLFPHWNWAGREGQTIPVWCHSNLDRVELFVNGKSLGAQDVPRLGHVAWQVPYAAGAIEARGYKDGRLVLTARRETTGAPARVALEADRAEILADGEDVSVITARVLDAQGRLVPYAGNEIAFHIIGGWGDYNAATSWRPGRIAHPAPTAGPPLGVESANGIILGVGNGDPSSHEPDKDNFRRAFNGLCATYVRATREAGSIELLGSSPGLASARLTVTTRATQPRPVVPPAKD